jgi:mono/diheme cytochrome c family protein
MSWQRITIVIGTAVATAGAGACSNISDDAGSIGTSATTAGPTEGRLAATAPKGLEAVGKRKCKVCHGENMAGQTKPLAGVTNPMVELYPPNLTPDIETGLGDPNNPDPAAKGYTDDLLARAIREGYDETDQQLCPQMKHYPDMSDFEVFSIVKVLRSLPPVKQKICTSVCPPLKTK